MTDTGKPLNAPVTLSLNLKLFGTAYPLLNVCRLSSAVDVVSGPNTWTFLFISVHKTANNAYLFQLCNQSGNPYPLLKLPLHWCHQWCLEGQCAQPLAEELPDSYCIPFTFFGIWMLSFNALGQGWLPFATVISKAVLVHLDNVLLSIKSLAQTSLTQCRTLFATQMVCGYTQP